MKKYIKLDGTDIIDVYFEYQKEKFNPSDIMLEETEIIEHKLRVKSSDPWKSISDEYGNPIFRWISNAVQSQNTDAKFLIKYKKQKVAQLKEVIKENLFEVTRTLDQIRTQFGNVKTSSTSWTTVAEVDTAYNQFITWLGI